MQLTTSKILYAIFYVALVVGGYIVAAPNEDDRGSGYVLLLLAYAVYGLLHLFKPDSTSTLIDYAVRAFPKAAPITNFDTAGPVIMNASIEVVSEGDQWLTLGGHTVRLSKLTSRRKVIQSLPTGQNGVESYNSYSVSYVCIAAKIQGQTPHIFIDGRAQNKFGRYSRDMWSLHGRLSRKDKIQRLEGNFSDYFSIYSADKNAIAALSIVTPDVMLQLRDNGLSFDYEIYNGHIYILHECTFRNGEADYQSYFNAMLSCLNELVPQLTNRSHITTTQLSLSEIRISFWALVHSIRVVFIHLIKVIGVLSLIIILGQLVR